MSFSQEVLERERMRGRTPGGGLFPIPPTPGAMDGTGGAGQPGGMGQKSSSTSQLSAAGNMASNSETLILFILVYAFL